MKKVIFSKYSNERAREFAIRTDILEDENHKRTVRKTACYPEGEQHIRNLVSWYQKLSEAYADTPISMNRCTLTEEGLEPEFVSGCSLEEELDEMLLAGDISGCVKRLMEYIDALRKAGAAQRFYVTEEFEKVFGPAVLPGNLTSASITDIDMLVANVIVTEKGLVHMDYEWTFEFPVPVNFVIYRTLMYYMEKGALRAALLKEDLYRYAGLTKQEIAQYVRMEACFQQYILGESVPLRQLYRSISVGYVDFQKEEKRRKQTLAMQQTEAGEAAIEICIDTLEEAAGMVFIQGWAVSKALRPLTFEVEDHCKREWRIEETRFMNRQDVNLSFGIAEQEYLAGFRLSCRAQQETKDEKIKYYVLKAKDGIASASVTIRADRLRVKNSRVGRKMFSLRGGGARHEIRYITPYERGMLGESTKFHRGEQRYDSFRKITELTEAEKKKQRQTEFADFPLISIAAAVSGADLKWLRQMLDSICAQTYHNWELCLAAADAQGQVKALLERDYSHEARIHYMKAEDAAAYETCINAAFEMTKGDYILVIGQNDTLEADAVFEIVRLWDSDKDAEIIYMDEDSVDDSGEIYTRPLLKPDYNPYMLNSTNYIGHGAAVKKEIVRETCGMRSGFDGAREYDFILRCCEKAQNIRHIPRVLYHCRYDKESEQNPLLVRAKWDMGRKALLEHYHRTGVDAKVEWAEEPQTYRTKWECKGMPKVSVIIPNMDHAEDLETCVRSIVDKTEYGNYEIVIVENNSHERKTFSMYEKLSKNYPQVRVLTWKDEFNYAAINNFAVRETDGEYLLFLNNDTEVISRGWMEEMLGICQQPQVGIVGAKLYFPDHTIQHAGVIIGLSGIAGHLFLGEAGDDNGYMARAGITQNLSAVTAACMMTGREAFEAVGGFDEKLKVALNDVDYCLKVVKSGRMVVYTPHAELYHYESKSRGVEDTPQKKARYEAEVQCFKERWPEILKNGDPFYHPNLSLTSWACALSV